MEKISVIGVGRLGICFSLLAEQAGYDVMACDNKEDYVYGLNRKEIKTFEPRVEELLSHSKNLTATATINKAIAYSDLLFCFVATPSLESGEYNHEHIEEVVVGLLEYESQNNGGLNGKTLLINCTVMPNYCKLLAERLLPYGMSVLYNPEFIAQGNIIHGLEYADYVLIGCDADYDLIDIYEIYGRIMNKNPTFKVTSHTGAEIVKMGVNCFLTNKLSFANMIGEIATESGEEENAKEILSIIGSDSRIGNDYFTFGFGAGGVCLPRDQRALGCHAENVGVSSLLLKSIDQFNWHVHLEYLKELFKNRNPDKDVPFVFNQLAYKKGVDIITDSHFFRLCEELLRDGYKVIINESQVVMDAVLPKLSKYNGQVTYGTVGTNSKYDERRLEGQKKQGYVIEL